MWFLLVVAGVPVGGLWLWMRLTAVKREQQFRRPFEEMPRPAGWSLQNRTAAILESISDSLVLCLLIAMTAFGVWLLKPAMLWPALAVGLVAACYFALRAKRQMTSYWNHRLGLLGEQVVGRILDQLSSDSIRVFHDLEVLDPGKKAWNIDHVVVAPAGVFAIETKTRRKPRGVGASGQPSHKVVYDGHQLVFPHPMKPDGFGLEQAMDTAKWLSDKLTALNGISLQVTPVLVLPGWWIEVRIKDPAVAVLNPKGLGGYLKSRKPSLSERQQLAIANQLEERCRIDLSRIG